MEQEDRHQQPEVVAPPGRQPRLSERATVVSPGADTTENSVIGQQQWMAIHERRRGGQSVSAIARDMDLDRKTVRSALKRREWAPYRRKAASSRLLEAHQAWLAKRAPKVHYSARILYQELTHERGFGGCYETVKLAVRPLRAEATLVGLTQRRFETGPGEQAQCDWGQVTVTCPQVSVPREG